MTSAIPRAIAEPVARRERARRSPTTSGIAPLDAGDDRHAGRQRLGQDHAELLLPARRRRGSPSTMHEALRVQRRHLVVGDAAAELDGVRRRRARRRSARRLLALGPGADDQQPTSGAPAAMPGAARRRARITSWWPFSQTSRPGESTRSGSPARRGGDGAKRSTSMPGRADDDRARGDALEQQARRGRARSRRGRGRSPASTRAPVARARAASGRSPSERDRLPHGQHEPEAERAPCSPAAWALNHVAELGGVHDVGARRAARRARGSGRRRRTRAPRGASAGQPVARRAHLRPREAESRRRRTRSRPGRGSSRRSGPAAAATAADPTGWRCSREAGRRGDGSRGRARAAGR